MTPSFLHLSIGVCHKSFNSYSPLKDIGFVKVSVVGFKVHLEVLLSNSPYHSLWTFALYLLLGLLGFSAITYSR